MSTNSAGMHFDDSFADGETESQSFALRIGLFEGVEDFFYKLWFDADAVVTDLDRDPSWVRIVRPHRNRAVFGSEFAGVVQHAPENLLQARCIGDQLVSRCREGNERREMSLFNVAAHDLHLRLVELMRVGLAQLQCQFSPRNPCKIEHVFYKTHLKFDISADHF